MVGTFKFKTEQKVLETAGVRFGGYKGENSTVLIGAIFYHDHKIVGDEKEGVFDKEAAEKLVSEQEELGDKTGIPTLLDVVGFTPEATSL